MAEPAIIIDDPAGDPPPNPPPAAPPSGDPPPSDPSAGDPPPSDPPSGDDWRSRMAGDNKDLLGFLGRYQSEKAFVEAAKKDRDQVRNKQVLKLPENPTDEELAAYRKEQGIPDKPEGYLEKLPNGLVVGDDDRPFVDKFLTNMLGTNAPPAMVNAALETYYGIVEEQAAEESRIASEAKNGSIEVLRDEWGPDYKRNLNIMHAHLDTLPAPVAEAFRSGKDANGVPLGFNADILKWVTGLALEANPLSTVVPGAGANQASAIATEIETIEKMMRTDRAAYNKDAKVQERYRELVTARLKLEGKS